MQICYLNNFKFTLAVAKPALTNYFTVDYNSAVPSQTFASAFRYRGSTYVNNPTGKFAVPITLVAADGTIKASGHVLKWDTTVVGSENRVYLDYALTQAAAIVGDRIECRMQEAHANAGASSFFRGVILASVANATYVLGGFNGYGEYCYFEVSAASTIQTPNVSAFIYPVEDTDYLQVGNSDKGPCPLHYCITLLDALGTQPALTWAQAPSTGTIKWETGVAPSFAVGGGRLMVELWNGGDSIWIGKWFRVPV